MTYYFARKIDVPFAEAVARTKAALSAQGFGVLSEIDVAATLKAKMGADLAPYLILGACNPQFAHRALLAEPKIGTMLPCNVIVQEKEPGKIEVSAVDPIASMQAIENTGLKDIAEQVREKLKRVIDLI